MANDTSSAQGVETGNPIEAALNAISRELAVAERNKEYKTMLEGLLQKTGSALEEYSGKKYAELFKRWKEQDQGLEELVNTLACRIPDWQNQLCTLVAPVYARLAALKSQLGVPVEPAAPEDGEREGLYTRRDREAVRLARAQRRYDEARRKLEAWEKPAQTIEKILNDDDKLANDIRKALGQAEAPALLYDLFFKLLPLHWLIAPPSLQAGVRADEYVINAGGKDAWRIVRRQLGPQPQLIEPSQYLQHVGAGPLEEYRAAQAERAGAEGDLKRTLEEIKRAEKALDEQGKSLEKHAKAALLSPVPPGLAAAPAQTGAAAAQQASQIA